MDVSEPASISAGIAGRYATAIFELSKEAGQIDAFESDVSNLKAALADSADLRDLIANATYTRAQQATGIASVGQAMGLSQSMAGGLGLMATKRRLFALPHLLTALADAIALEKGEVTADVIAATTLTDEQKGRLADALQSKTGKTVKLNVAVDESLIGGMIVKLGSRMIDTSVSSKLASLTNTMKEVG
ncbi:ATP synthase F1 subunit delta [Thioclava sp. SK-1]|uniref:F0F1 ATP synthase subunit delta n=1 Tax=Thioclava sp. SK-1 TaxID=1889770 RepID=UPI00082476BB|nr:F0F1 ATP synthase subunit delta [Thioclava sp. SK-1]OCX66207.1 ATP synthase F1 subunit delta [Thioclava sp. SK-1]